MKTVVFVCTVNRWRSPMAEYLFRDILKRKKPEFTKQIKITSAGIIVDEEKADLIKKRIELPEPVFGYRPLVCVIYYLMKRGIDSSGHRSRELTNKIAHSADLIIGMVDKHKDIINKTYPMVKDKVVSLEELSSPFQLPEIKNEPPGLMPPDKFCMLECNHWHVTDKAISMIENKLEEAMPKILNILM
ncbi:MAG: hypothetical protein JRJ57_03900 [Deltaproteobacteria bacterium]|nr:hypothetical protein [Deltaproteobacteria bacterium]